MTETPHKRLGDALLDAGLATSDELTAAAAEGKASHHRLGEVLIDHGITEERDVYRALAALHGLSFQNSDDLLARIDPALAHAVPQRFQEFHKVIPIVLDGHDLVVATSDPLILVPELGAALGAKQVSRIVVTPTDLRRLRMAITLEQAGRSQQPAPAQRQAADLLFVDPVATESAQRLLDGLLLDAVAERASDIHIETYRGQTRIRIRVDGDLRDLTHYRLTDLQRLGLVNVIKVRADLDIAEHRLPQGGRFVTRSGKQVFDLRVQTQPCLHGEHVVMRLLPQDTTIVGVDELGFPPEIAKTYRRLFESPGGLILVVGPTGSGKSTTLYAGLQLLAADATRKVITIEDPIEYALDGIQQTQVKPEIGFEFAHAMRAFVREDPDVILLGEIRDGETALEALRASQTGHLVLSTLHCNDTVDAVQRLVDLGMHRNSIGSELLAVFSQRLARRVCEGCRAPTTPPQAMVDEVFPGGVPATMHFFAGTGCEHCRGTGCYGRIAAIEYLPASPALRQAIARGATVDELRGVALEAGLLPLRDHALMLVDEGLIPLGELRTMLPPERLAPER
ncbi:MAG: type II/IV secretion system protein [Gemmatimonadetes bacterium]|nr:type II/IV secretion system protein [Gemmatimonadota bacterium]